MPTWVVAFNVKFGWGKVQGKSQIEVSPDWEPAGIQTEIVSTFTPSMMHCIYGLSPDIRANHG